MQGKVEYNEETARIEAFSDLARKVPKDIFKNYLKDKYYKENCENIKNKNYQILTEPMRNVNPFYAFNHFVLYSVEYEDDYSKTYYYNALGHLVKFEINDFAGNYPYRAIAYDRHGNVINIAFVVSMEEAYVFDKNEKLLGHWNDKKFFDKKGKIKNYTRILE